MKQANKRPDYKKGLLIALCIVLAVILAVLIVALVMLHKFDQYKGQINYVNNNAVKESELYDQMRQDGDLLEDDDQIVNILLIGQDAREGQGRQRSDSMILCTLNLHTDTLTMTSFMRDMKVAIPGYGQDKLNAAYAIGGMELLDLTLLQNFGVVVDYNVAIDFYGFMDLVDDVGGINMELTQEEASYLNSRGNWDIDDSTAGQWDLKAGNNHLTGEQTLAYCRIRYIGNADFGRTDRQRKVIFAMLDICKSMSISELDRFLMNALPLVTTDMSSEQIDIYVAELLPRLKNLKPNELRIPADGTWSNDESMSYLIVDFDKNKEILQEAYSK